MEVIHVGVFDEHEIFRRGLVACLREEPRVRIVDDPGDPELDVALVSPTLAQQQSFACPVLVCGGDAALDLDGLANRVLGVLPRATLTAQQLLGGVHAAAAGFRVGLEPQAANGPLDARGLSVLQLLAQGYDTRQIARALSCSERTVKQAVVGIRQRLGARNRAHAVAEGIRQGVI